MKKDEIASPKATATASVRELPQQEIPLFSAMPDDAVIGRARCDIQRGQAITAVMIGNVSDSGTAATIGGERAKDLAFVIAEAKRTLYVVQRTMECNADDERRWAETIKWLESLA